MEIYLDNAATTRPDAEVINIIKSSLENNYGNPFSTHSFGREAKTSIENVRKKISGILKTNSQNIIFTSGGTEANNWIINKSIENLGINHIITSKIEHYAILKPLEYHKSKNNILNISYVDLDSKGHIDYNHLESILSVYNEKKHIKTLVSLMHANNEIANITDIEKIGQLCKQYNSLFHSDTAQTIGHYKFDLESLNIHFLICSAHKFHGPKGVGFIYIRDNIKINPMICGGGQEFGLRGGTENVYGIIGMGKAIEVAYENLEKDKLYITSLKAKLIDELKKKIPEIKFNGDCENLDKSLYKIINIQIPTEIPNDLAILKLDMQGIAVSAGSACSSGTLKQSHVIENLNTQNKNGSNNSIFIQEAFLKNNKDIEKENTRFPNIRISLSKYNKEEEIDIVVKAIKNLC